MRASCSADTASNALPALSRQVPMFMSVVGLRLNCAAARNERNARLWSPRFLSNSIAWRRRELRAPAVRHTEHTAPRPGKRLVVRASSAPRRLRANLEVAGATHPGHVLALGVIPSVPRNARLHIVVSLPVWPTRVAGFGRGRGTHARSPLEYHRRARAHRNARPSGG